MACALLGTRGTLTKANSLAEEDQMESKPSPRLENCELNSGGHNVGYSRGLPYGDDCQIVKIAADGFFEIELDGQTRFFVEPQPSLLEFTDFSGFNHQDQHQYLDSESISSRVPVFIPGRAVEVMASDSLGRFSEPMRCLCEAIC